MNDILEHESRFISRVCIFALASFYIGCFTSVDEILLRPPSSWTNRECQTLIVSKISHNLAKSGVNIYVTATPYYPSVVAAINRMQAAEYHWDDSTTQVRMDALLKTGVGLYKDWESKGKLVNSRGNYYRTPDEIDSMLFLISLKNQTWPCNVPVRNVVVGVDRDGSIIYGMRPLTSMADWPCYIPEIDRINEHILLVNDRADTLQPKVVWGRRNNQLTMDEHLLVLFQFRRVNTRSFLSGCKEYRMILTGFDQTVELPFSVNKIE